MNTGNPLAQGARLVFEDDAIKPYEASLREFFADIFGMAYDTMLVADDACLSDFAFSGDWPMPELAGVPLPDLYRAWDAWVLPRICARYDLEVNSFKPTIRLIALMSKISERAATRVH